MRSILILIVILMGSVCSFAQTQDERPRVVVGHFDRAQGKKDKFTEALETLFGSDENSVAHDVRTLLIDRLVNGKRYVVVAPDEVERITRAHPEIRSSAGLAKLGELTGAKYYVFGSIGKAKIESSMNVFKRFDAVVDVTFRILDLASGEVAFSKSIKGTDWKTTLKSGEEGRNATLDDDEAEKLMKTATSRCVSAFLTELDRFKPRTAATTPTAGAIEVEFTGLESLGQARDLTDALAYVNGVDKVERLSYEQGVGRFRISTASDAGALGVAIEKAEKLGSIGFAATVVEEKPGRLKVKLTKRSS